MKTFDGGLVGKDVWVGIDQSYSGFAITLLNDSGYKTTVYKAERRGIQRLQELKTHLLDVILDYNVKDVALEGYAFGSQMANMLGELGGMVKLTLLDCGLYPLIVPPTTLKKFATGKGTGVSKSQILLNVYKNWGAEFTDDNAADSYVLAMIAAGKYTHAYQKEIFTKLQDPKFRER